MAKKLPEKNPFWEIDILAYSEQVGENLQELLTPNKFFRKPEKNFW